MAAKGMPMESTHEATLDNLALRIAEGVATLEGRRRRVEGEADIYFRDTLAAALLVREARERVERGEAGAVKWLEWSRKHLKIGRTWMHYLTAVADAPDPAKLVQRQRAATLKRVQAHRARTAAQLREPDRKELIAWARKADIAEARRILRMIRSVPQDATAWLHRSRAFY
jgi:hypothetical protein